MSLRLRMGTRGSKLALAQTRIVQEALQKTHPGLECQVIVVRTSGDKLSAEGTLSTEESAAIKGLFVKELEEALLTDEIDLAIHSVKDMETDLPEALTLGAVLKREDPRDALVVRDQATLKTLPPQTVVGVSSLRRESQLRRLRRDLEVEPIRGNVDTRLRKLEQGEVGALILAVAGLVRLGLSDRIAERIDPAQMLPAPAQGALGIEIRRNRPEIAVLVKTIDHEDSHWEILAERTLLGALGGGCRVPVGALARVDGENLTLTGAVLSPDGLKLIRKEVSGGKKQAQRLGKELASHLRAVGADRLLYGHWGQKAGTV